MDRSHSLTSDLYGLFRDDTRDDVLLLPKPGGPDLRKPGPHLVQLLSV